MCQPKAVPILEEIVIMTETNGRRGTRQIQRRSRGDGLAGRLPVIALAMSLSACAATAGDGQNAAAPPTGTTTLSAEVSTGRISSTFQPRMNSRVTIPCEASDASWFRYTSQGFVCIGGPAPEPVAEGTRREIRDCPDGRWIKQDGGDFLCTPTSRPDAPS
ncbi:hypothetical protein VY88_17400 [Azospirillum thiophilum]|nr:hypothetical protein [Azospirillum thiophilum]KJR64502.1 hypothetical protein VY88_17400 [Azospirillum thiophilum]